MVRLAFTLKIFAQPQLQPHLYLDLVQAQRPHRSLNFTSPSTQLQFQPALCSTLTHTKSFNARSPQSSSRRFSIMLGFTFFSSIAAIALFAPPSTCLPQRAFHNLPGAWKPASDLSNLAKLMPTRSGLPAPDGDLKYVVLGMGTQNYTCLTGKPDAAPGTTGATGKPSLQLALNPYYGV